MEEKEVIALAESKMKNKSRTQNALEWIAFIPMAAGMLCGAILFPLVVFCHTVISVVRATCNWTDDIKP